jgi:hypothetical protein
MGIEEYVGVPRGDFGSKLKAESINEEEFLLPKKGTKSWKAKGALPAD